MKQKTDGKQISRPENYDKSESAGARTIVKFLSLNHRDITNSNSLVDWHLTQNWRKSVAILKIGVVLSNFAMHVADNTHLYTKFKNT